MSIHKSKKILFLLDCLYGDAGGGSERQFLKLYGESEAMGIDPYVVFLRDQQVHGSIEWKRPPLVLGINSIASIGFARGALRLKGLLIEENIRVVHTLFDDASVLGAAVKALVQRTMLVVSQRNLGYARRGLRKLLIAGVFRSCDRIVVNAKAIGELVSKQYWAPARKIVAISNIYDKNADCVPEKVEQYMGHIRSRHHAVAVIIANLRPVKGIDDLLAAVAMTRQVADIGYVVVGDGGGLEHYMEIIRKAGLDNEVYLLGYKEDAGCYLMGADIAILPSRSEGLSNSLVEYMFAGLPIGATDVGGSREALEEGRCGKLVPAENPAALADAIIGIVTSDDAGRTMGHAARESARKRYNRTTIIQAYRELYWDET